MSAETDLWFSGFFIGYVFGQLLGILVVALVTDVHWKQEATKRGFALYDPVTGKWCWRKPTDAPAPPSGDSTP